MKKLFLIILLSYPFFQSFSQWQMLNGPYETQGINILSKHPNGYLFAAGEEFLGGNPNIYRSTNFGSTWLNVSPLNIPIDGIFSIDFDPVGNIYAGTWGKYFYSSNFGDSWTTKDIQQSISIRAFVFNSLGHIFIGGGGFQSSYGIYRSTNGGNLWHQIFDIPVGDLFLDENDNIFAATTSGVYHSSDNGQNWNLRSNGLPSTSFQSIKRNLQGELFIHSLDYGIYKSSDNGLNWSITGIPTDIITSWDLKIDNNDYLYVCKWDYGVFRSTNSGHDWQLFPLGRYVQCSIVDDQNNLFAGNDKALYQYSEIDSTFHLGTAYKALGNILNFNFCADSTIYASTLMRLWRSTDLGLNWNNINDQTTQLVAKGLNDRIFISSPLLYSDNCGDDWITPNISYSNKIYVHSNGELYSGTEKIYKSSDNGTTWDLLSGWIFPYAATPTTIDLRLNSLGHIFLSQNAYFSSPPYSQVWVTMISTNNGSSFQPIYTTKKVFSIELDSNEHIILGTDGAGVLKSDNNGTTWIAINSGLTSLYINDLTYSPEGILLAATNDGVFRYWEDSNYWSQLNTTGLLMNKIRSISYHNNVLFAGTHVGMAYFTGELPVELSSFTASLNGRSVLLNWATASEVNNYGFEIQRKLPGQEWIPISFVKGNNTTASQNTYTYVDLVSDFNFTGTISYRLKQVDFDGTFDFSHMVEIDLPAEDFELYQNYPNPFNPSTSIRFSIPEKTNVTIVLYNTLGERIKTLISNEEKYPGNYSVEFDGSDFSSGVYFYTLITPDFQQVKKMILAK